MKKIYEDFIGKYCFLHNSLVLYYRYSGACFSGKLGLRPPGSLKRLEGM